MVADVSDMDISDNPQEDMQILVEDVFDDLSDVEEDKEEETRRPENQEAVASLPAASLPPMNSIPNATMSSRDPKLVAGTP